MSKEHPVFAWYDDTYLANKKLVNPLALASRALLIAEYHQATAREHGDDQEQWVVYGIADAAAGLAKHGEFNALGVLFAGLEALVPAGDRAKWPLSDAKEPGPRRRRAPRASLVEQQVREIVEDGEREG